MPQKKQTHRERPRKTAEELRKEYRASRPTIFKIDPHNIVASLDLLNSALIFEGRVKFKRIWRRGLITYAKFSTGRTAEWTSTDLRVFSRSQDILFGATGFLIPSLGRTAVKTWEPIAQIISTIADQDSIDLEPPLKEEFREILRAAWIRAFPKEPREITDKDEFLGIVKECQHEAPLLQTIRPRRCCVWVGGAGELAPQYAWIYQEALMEWIGQSKTKSKFYAWEDVRKGLMLLGFEPDRLHPSKNIYVRVLRGPIDVLVEEQPIFGVEQPPNES